MKSIMHSGHDLPLKSAQHCEGTASYQSSAEAVATPGCTPKFCTVQSFPKRRARGIVGWSVHSAGGPFGAIASASILHQPRPDLVKEFTKDQFVNPTRVLQMMYSKVEAFRQGIL